MTSTPATLPPILRTKSLQETDPPLAQRISTQATSAQISRIRPLDLVLHLLRKARYPDNRQLLGKHSQTLKRKRLKQLDQDQKRSLQWKLVPRRECRQLQRLDQVDRGKAKE